MSHNLFKKLCQLSFITILLSAPYAHAEPLAVDVVEPAITEIIESKEAPFEEFAEDGVKTMSYWKEFFRMMMILGAILGVVLILAWLLRHFLNKRIQLANESNLIKVLERRNLSQKSMLYLVEIHGKQHLIGDSQAGGVEYLALCSENEASQESSSTFPLKEAKDSFMSILQRKLNEKKPSLLKIKK